MTCLILIPEAYSQGTDLRGKQSHLYIGFSFIPAQTNIVNNGTSSVSRLITSSAGNSYSGSFEIGYQFSKFFGLASGIGYNSYSTQLTLDDYKDSIANYKDSDNESYLRKINGRNILEIQEISFLNIPLMINLQIPFGNVFGIFVQPGINFSYPLTKKYSTSGLYDYWGYYKDYNVTIKNFPEGDFESNVNSDVSGELKLKPYYTEFSTSGGIYFLIRKKVQFCFGAYYSMNLTGLSDYTTSSPFRLSTMPNEVSSMMAGSSKVSANAMGYKLTFRYFFK
jgi:hypothetical protein